MQCVYIKISFRMKRNCNQLQKANPALECLCPKKKEIKSIGKLGPTLECFYAKKTKQEETWLFDPFKL